MAIKRLVCFSFSLASQEPMAYVRLIAPFRHLGIQIINGWQNLGVDGECISQGDVVVIQREFPLHFNEYQKIMEIARQEEKPVVLELDDLLFFLPETHPDRWRGYYAAALLPMLQALVEADAVTVATSKMQEVLADYNENIIVIPNYLDDSLWSCLPVYHKPQPATLTIGYMGTYSHQPDVEYVTPVLLNLLERYQQRLSLRFWGLQPPSRLRSHPQVEWVPCNYRSYQEFAIFFQTQSADIFIAPLVDNLFNRCKSSLKFFEYSALGAPGVFSRLEPYEGIIQHGHNGLLADSLDEWEDCLVQLIEDDELRFRIAVQAQATVRENWLLSQNAFRWHEALQKIAHHRQAVTTRDISLLKMLQSINAQLFEASQALNSQLAECTRTIQMLNGQLEEQTRTIHALNQEILGYVLSTSWRMTRPFRAVARKLNSIGRKGHAESIG